MPFTPAHTAIVLPFLRMRNVSATGLVVGSVAPDFEYFFKMSVDGVHGHTWPGLLYFDLPVTLLLSILFHQVVKRNLILNLPVFLAQRFRHTLAFDFKTFIRKQPVVFMLSALAGSATHIVWDGFTHGTGFFVNYFSFYDGAYFPFQGVNYPLWYALQHISTFVGLTILFIYIALLKREPVKGRPRSAYWVWLVLVSLLVVGLRFLIHSRDYNLGNLVVSSISALCVSMVICGLIPLREPLNVPTESA